MLKWVWNGIEVSLPPDWEMLQFSKDRERGRCAFADRYTFRFELSWAPAPGKPDFGRMMSDYKQKLESEQTMTNVRSMRLSGCPGLTGQTQQGSASRYGKYIEEQHRLLEAVFLWPQAPRADLERAVLASLAPVSLDAEGCDLWRAFGMELRVPASWAFSSCTVQAAKAGFLFRGSHAAETWIFRRLGLVERWLQTDLETWIHNQTPADIVERRMSHSSEHDVDHVRLSGRYRPKAILGRKGGFEASAWKDPRDRRLYLAMLTTPHHSPHAGRAPEKYLKAAPDFTVIPGADR